MFHFRKKTEMSQEMFEVNYEIFEMRINTKSHVSALNLHGRHLKEILTSTYGYDYKFKALNSIFGKCRRKVPIPDESFEWLLFYRENEDDILKLLMKEKLKLDSYITNVIEACEELGFNDHITFDKLIYVMKTGGLYFPNHFVYLLNLLRPNFITETLQMDTSYIFTNNFAVKNIRENYVPLFKLIDKLMQGLAHFGRFKSLQMLQFGILHYKIQYKFDPEKNRNLLNWIEKNADNTKRGDVPIAGPISECMGSTETDMVRYESASNYILCWNLLRMFM